MRRRPGIGHHQPTARVSVTQGRGDSLAVCSSRDVDYCIQRMQGDERWTRPCSNLQISLFEPGFTKSKSLQTRSKPSVGAHTEEIFISLLSWAQYNATVGPLVSLTVGERLANGEGMKCTYIIGCKMQVAENHLDLAKPMWWRRLVSRCSRICTC